jgi:hypothetical protein
MSILVEFTQYYLLNQNSKLKNKEECKSGMQNGLIVYKLKVCRQLRCSILLNDLRSKPNYTYII